MNGRIAADANIGSLGADRLRIIRVYIRTGAGLPAVAGVVERALDKMGRMQVGRGIAGADGVVVLYVGKDGAWNLVLVRPSGMVCPLGGGDDWEMTVPKPKGERS